MEATMRAKEKADGRRLKGTSKHAGVVLARRDLPSGKTSWRARYTDPDSGALVWETLSADDAATEQSRAEWAIKKADAIKERAKDLKGGAPRKTGRTLEDAVARYLEDVAYLRPNTRASYESTARTFVAWAATKSLTLGDELRGEHLMEFRGWLANRKKRAPKKGGKNHAHEDTKRARSAHTTNRELRAIKTCLEYLRRLGLLPLVTRDAIADNLENLDAPRPVPEHLEPRELVKLVAAAARHDTTKYALTRDEKAAGFEKGETPRFAAVLPYLATVLLSGMRADEARSLRWERVDLDAAPAGRITLEPEDVKTKIGRTIDLSVSPLLREILATMKLKAGDATFVFGDVEKKDELGRVVRDEKGKPVLIPALTPGEVKAAYKRLPKKHGAPRFSWQVLRSTCGTYLANAPGIFGAASAYREARQLGHSVTIAEKHYLGVVHIAPDARTLEDAMGVAGKLREALDLPAMSSQKAEKA